MGWCAKLSAMSAVIWITHYLHHKNTQAVLLYLTAVKDAAELATYKHAQVFICSLRSPTMVCFGDGFAVVGHSFQLGDARTVHSGPGSILLKPADTEHFHTPIRCPLSWD